MIRRPPRSTQGVSSAASDVYKRQINQSDTLNARMPNDTESERHICPLQLPVIERCLRMYSNPGDVVFTPFLGIGSEVYQAVKMGRKGIGIELKPAYFDAAVQNIKAVETEMHQASLFDMGETT